MPPVEIWCTNPAAQTIYSLLKNTPDQGGSEILQNAWKVAGGGIRARLRTVRGSDVLSLGFGHDLRFILTPTPRWPGEMSVYDPASQLLFSSKLFSAHVGDPDGHEVDHFDDGGWAKFGKDWGWFYECMLAPVAKQARRGPRVPSPSALSRLISLSQGIAERARPPRVPQTNSALDRLDVEVIPMGPVLAAPPKKRNPIARGVGKVSSPLLQLMRSHDLC